MAAKSTCVDLKGILSILKILSNTDRSKVTDLRSIVAITNNFDDLLMLNLHLLWQALECNESLKHFGEVKMYFCGLFEQKSCSKDKETGALSCTEVEDISVLNKTKQNKSSFNLSEARTTNINSRSVRWIFCQICLHTLRLLKSTLRDIKSSDNSPKGPTVDLSISDQQIVKTVIQLIVVLGICPNLLEGVGIPFEQRTGFSDALSFGQDKVIKCPKCLCHCVMTLVHCLNEPSLSLLILSKHLADVLASLMQLGYCREVCEEDDFIGRTDSQDKLAGNEESLGLSQENSSPESTGPDKLADEELTGVSIGQKDTQMSELASGEKLSNTMNICEGDILISKTQQQECKKALNNIINKMYQPLIIRELLFLQGSMSGQKATKPKESHTEGRVFTRTPKWMKDVCGHLLSKCLTKKNGVQSVLRAVLEAASGAASEWKICEAIAQVIANCPIQIQSPDEYYRSISPQVLTLLQLPSSKLQQQYSRASVLIIHAMLRKYPEIATKYIADPLKRPFLIATREPGENSKTVLVDEREMTCCIEGLHKVFVASPNYSHVMTENMERIIIPVFELFCFVRHSASHVNSISSKLFSLAVLHGKSIIGSVLLQEETSVPGENLRCLVEPNWKHSSDMRLRTALLELLSTFFKRTNNHTALVSLYVFVCKELPNSESKNAFLNSENITKHSGDIGKHSEDVGGHSEDVGKHSEDIGKPSEVHIPKITLMAKHCSFGYGESGGVILEKTDASKTKMNENAFGEIFGKGAESYETRALCLVEVLQNLRKDEIPGSFFLYLLQQVQEIILNPNFREIGRMKALVIFNVLALMCEKLGPSVLKNTGHMIQFIDTTLTRAHHVYMECVGEESGAGVFELETLTMALGMLSALLGGAVKVEASDYVKLQRLTPILREIAENHVQEEITEQANDLLVFILTKTTVLSEETKRTREGAKGEGKGIVKGEKGLNIETSGSKWDQKDETGSDLDFDTALEQLCDPLLPVRGHALMRLATLLKSRDPKALERVDILVKTFRDSLIHDDSYIYLAAVEGLVTAADVRTDDVIPYLAREFMVCCGEGTEATGSGEDKGEYKGFDKGKDKKEIVKRSSTTRLKVGEALVRAVKRCGELVPRYFQILIHAFLVGARDKDRFVRASSFSNLGEMCRLSPHMLHTVVHEMFHCINTVLRSDEANEVRRAAVLVLTLVLKGLGQKIVEVLSDKLKDIYQLLKYVKSSDQDETTRIHAQVALGGLESIMREQLFPEQRLVKHIHVLQ